MRLLASLLLAASAVAAQAQQPDAVALAKKVDAHYNALRSLQVNFSQAYDGMGMHRVEAGTLLLGKGGRFHEGRMRWTYSQPAGKLFVFTGKFAYFYTPGQTEIQRVPAKQLDDLRSPLALLLGHANLATQLDRLTIQPGPHGESTLSGIPKGLEQRVESFRVTASPDGVIHRLEIEDVDGSRNSFTFTGEQANVAAPDSAFDFTPQPGTNVVDGMPPI